LARKILLADDSVTAQNMGRKILADAGYDVITVNNGSAALKKIAELKPELIILDVYMPGYSGLEVCQRLKDSPETARVPVLLSVGKLEPFKPDEAKRVRAEGYIIKPFEASELLSALSKLEDKIVPKAEAGKPGRLGRAVAGVSESSGDEPVAEGSWKNRISFPSKKKEAAPEPADDSAMYNPVNRDLKTVVQHDTAQPDTTKIHSVPAAEAHRHDTEAAKPEEKLVDLGALPPAGLPKDVTTEEIAALAAAAAQVQARKIELESAAKAEPEETKKEEAAATPRQPEEVAATQTIQDTAAAHTAPHVAAPTEDEVAAAIARLEQEQVNAPEQLWNVNAGNGVGQSTKDRDDVPVTMATPPIAEPVESPRWTAVSVAVDPQEAALSLEREMQSAFRAFTTAAAAQAGPAATLIDEAKASASVPKSTEPNVEPSPVVVSTIEAMPEPSPVASTQVAETVTASATEFAVAQGQEVADHSEQPDYSVAVPAAQVEAVPANVVPESVTAETVVQEPVQPISFEAAAPQDLPQDIPQEELQREDIRQEAVSEIDQPAIVAPNEPVSSEVTSADSGLVASEAAPLETISAVVAVSEDAAEQTADQPTVAADLPVIETAEVTPKVSQSQIEQEEHVPQPEAAHKNETELAATTAAAWASWRQIRDSIPAAKNLTGESAGAEDAREAAPLAANALAVAAGAEASPSEVGVPPQAKSVDSQTVASIVDSLLAELRPRIVEEISRKLAAEKK
jgi:CheY-like chemotaxis protein